LAVPPQVKMAPLKMTKESGTSPRDLVPTSSRESSGISRAIRDGIAGGISGGVLTGVSGGVAGGVRTAEYQGKPSADILRARDNAAESYPAQTNSSPAPVTNAESVSGVVDDPSGARAPEAIVSLRNQDTGEENTIITDEAGEFSLQGLPTSHYEIEVRKLGFSAYQEKIDLGAEKRPVVLKIVLEPARTMQSMEVTAKALPGAPIGSEVAGPKRIRVGGSIEATKLVESPKAEYPQSARARGIQGLVLLVGVISIEGNILSLRVLSSPDPALSEAAMEAVKRWRYVPTLLNGEPIEVVTTIAVKFHLDHD